ncbi:MAG: hypothetical protein H0X03_08445 [Nitrosopumilus sp.]|nr:hypothetical protein [Nitrosopumilus sp.]
MGQVSFFEINLSYKDINQILDDLYSNIEKTNNNKIKNIYKILDTSKDAISSSLSPSSLSQSSLSQSSPPKTSTKIKLRHDQWIKIIECCQSNEYITELLESKINFLKKYKQKAIN